MRKLVVVALAGILTLAVAAVAIAATGTSGTTEQEFEQTYSQKRTNRSTGTVFSTSSTDPANTAKNQQPKRVTNFDITFPAGSKIDSKAAPQCSATDDELIQAENPDRECPRGSKLGSGKVAARTPFNGVADFTGTVVAYNANKGLILLVNVQSANQQLVLRPKFRGRRLLTPVPHTCIPPNRPDQGCRPGGTGEPQEAILTSFELKTKAVSRRDGRRRRQLITTPRSCPRGGWTFEADITYADGSKLNIPTRSPCS
jgi:hypothetical protein